ncbi:MAG TPA: hypothetical protein VK762_22720 [Polyangiaceae bacterium]|nr:hypothetical protein [Polyangiaceae bacterium]
MRSASLALFGLVAACSSGAAAVGGSVDASSDAPVAPVVDAAADVIPDVDAAIDADAAPDPCAEAGVPASTLACTGLYADFATKEVAANAYAYTPSTPLWSDGAQKQRWIELPANTQIDISNPNEWTFPVGTKLFKEFRVEGKRVETRMFQKQMADFWVYATYAWNSDDSAATINFGGPVPVPVGDGGTTWTIPSNDDCNECHRGRLDRILGFEQVGLGLPGAQGLTLAQLAEMGLVTPAPANVSLAIGDDGTGLDALALGWLHVNCGVTCHNSNPSAAGYGAGMLLRLDPSQLDGTPPNAATWDILNTTVNVPCVSGSVAGLPRIRPHDAASSVIDQLIGERGALQMPPIASLVVDTPDVAVVSSWIQAMATDAGAPPLEAGAFDGGEHHARDAGELDAGADSAAPLDSAAPGPDAMPGDGSVAEDAD